MINKRNQVSFSMMLADQRKIKRQFFEQVNRALNWNDIEAVLGKYYKKGFSVDGRPAHSSLVLFKMCLLQYWYGLSDYEVEAQCNDSLSFTYFLGLALEDQVPDHSTVSRFRSELTKNGGWEPIFNEVNRQLAAHHVIVKEGCIVDASITDSPLKPKGKTVHPVAEDRKETTDAPPEQTTQQQESTTATPPTAPKHTPNIEPTEATATKCDSEAAWIKKAGKLHYGYKKHLATDTEGMVLAVVTTPANKSDVVHLLDVVAKAELPPKTPVAADKGYCSKKNRDGLSEMKLKSRIMRKATRGKPLSKRAKWFNAQISKYRFVVERTFGSMKLWSGAAVARYRGLANTHTQHLLEATAHNIYRTPGLAVLATERKYRLKG